MIGKFNFYDIYGYLIPGLLVVGLFWVPFGLLLHKWPATDVGSAVLTVVVAYVLGHVVQLTVNGIVPPKIKDAFGKIRFPSDVLLDTKSALSSRLKTRIAERCLAHFDIDISEGKDPGNTEDKEQMDRVSFARGEAFLRARSALIRDGNKGYAEQFQGLYAMVAGILVGLGIASCYFVGWAAAFWEYSRSTNHSDLLIWIEIILIVLAAIFAVQSLSNEIRKDRAKSHDEGTKAKKTWKALEKALAFTLAAGSLWAGVLIGCTTLTSNRSDAAHHDLSWMMILLAVGAVFVAIRLYGSYRMFAMEFAKTVWRDFGDVEQHPPTPTTTVQFTKNSVTQ
jgi:F0F1-type ATP synthase assembly protein I